MPGQDCTGVIVAELHRAERIKSEQSLLTIVEFKKYRLDEIDSKKVQELLKILKTCRHGAVVGFVEMPATIRIVLRASVHINFDE